MRILVAGPFPPAPDRAAADVLALVGRLIAEGHDVEVLSPLPSAAGLHGTLTGIRGALLLARRARSFDALHLHVSRFMLFRPELAQYRRILDGVALALALRLWPRTSAQLGDLSDVPGGGGGLSGRLVWSSIDEITVSAESVRNHAVKVLHFPAAKVKVDRAAVVLAGRPEAQRLNAAALAAQEPGAEMAPWNFEAGATWEDVMAGIRQRAASQRSRGPDSGLR